VKALNPLQVRIIRTTTAVVVALAGIFTLGCSMTVEAVNPSPNVTVSGEGTYSVDVAKVPDVRELGNAVTINDVRKSVKAGFRMLSAARTPPRPTLARTSSSTRSRLRSTKVRSASCGSPTARAG